MGYIWSLLLKKIYSWKEMLLEKKNECPDQI